MKPDCIILYGLSVLPGAKHAGPFRIATELRKHGYNVQCIDITMFSDEDLFFNVVNHLISEKTLWLGLSTTFIGRNTSTWWNRLLENCVKNIREIHPNLQIIAGGNHYLNFFQNYKIKLFKGYADSKIVKFTKWCTDKKNTYEFLLPTVEGEEFKEFTQSQIEYIDTDIVLTNEALPIEISRGCIFRCKFCSFPLNGKTKGDYIKLYDGLLTEFNRNYENHGITRYTFSDDTYNDSVDKVKGLYDNVFSKLPFKIEFTTYLRLDLMMRFPETEEYLKESGLKSALFGIETLNEQSAKIIGKGVPPREQFEYIAHLKNYNFKDIAIMSGIILGLPYDTIDTIEETQEFLLSDKNKMDRFDIFPLYIDTENPAKDTFSEFELNYEKYGYNLYTSNGQVKWKNTKTGLTFDRCRVKAQIIENLADKNKKNKFSGFGYSYFQSLGITDYDLDNFSSKDLSEKYNINQLIVNFQKEYIDKLLDVINFPKQIDNK
jgi:2-iminoacetate synthase ThiH